MPVIEGADLTKVDTDRQPHPEAEYLLTISSSELSDDKKNVIIKMKIEEPAEVNGTPTKGREYWDFINITKKDGTPNEFGWTTIKRYMEAVFGKDSAEAQASPPDTDVLNGHQIRQYLVIDEFDRKDGSKGSKNKAKRIFKA